MNGAQLDQNAKMTFDGLDKNRDLLVTFEEMRVAHESMGVPEEFTRKLMEHADIDGDGALNFEEYKAAYKMQRNQG